MTYIFSVIGKIPDNIEGKIRSRFGNDVIISSRDFILAGHGLPETFAYKQSTDSFIGVCGVPLIKIGDKYKLVRESHLDDVAADLSNAGTLEGHFTFFSKSGYILTIVNDVLGYREYFEFVGKGYSIVATELGLIAEIIGGCDLNMDSLATSYLLKLQLDKNALVHNINRYCGGTILQLTNSENGISKKISKLIEPNISINSEDAIKTEIVALSLPIIEGFQTTISMSGGLDSRFLLSLLKPVKPELQAVGIGFSDHPDNITGKLVSETVSMPYDFYDTDDREQYHYSFVDIINYIKTSKYQAPASEYLFKRLCDFIYDKKFIQVDAGWAEIGRRNLFASIYYHSKYRLKKFDNELVFGLIQSSKPDIFNEEISRQMRTTALAKVESIIEKYRMYDSKNLGRRLDQFSIDFKISNNISGEQTRTDNSCISLSPFNQRIINRALIELPYRRQLDGRFFRESIINTYPSLSKIDLVKGTKSVPFSYGTLTSRLYLRFKQDVYTRNYSVEMFKLFRDEILSLLSESETQSCQYYDKAKLNRLINGVRVENHKSCEIIDQLLTFETYRRSVENPKNY